jgi:hypothetical protein
VLPVILGMLIVLVMELHAVLADKFVVMVLSKYVISLSLH